MIIESLIVGTSLYIYNNWDKIKIKRKWSKIINSTSKFTNKTGTPIRLYKIQKVDYGYKFQVKLPYSYTKKNLSQDLDIFTEALEFKSIQITSDTKYVYMHCINTYEFKQYIPIELPPNKILIADGLTTPIIVNLNNFPHVLIGGDTGTGKTRILLVILTNLIHFNSNIDIHLLQIRKNDLGVFAKCKQVKTNSKTIEEILTTLEKINYECIKREKLIDNTKGYYNIADYNANTRNKKLNYIYVVIEEFSFLNIKYSDSKEMKKMKSKCLTYIQSIVNVGRSSGIFLITALQKPTNDSIPTAIKSQLSTRISLCIKDAPAARVILGNDKNTTLSTREIIVRTLDEEYGHSYTIDHKTIMKNIKNSIIEKKIPKKKFPPKQPPKQLSADEIISKL